MQNNEIEWRNDGVIGMDYECQNSVCGKYARYRATNDQDAADGRGPWIDGTPPATVTIKPVFYMGEPNHFQTMLNVMRGEGHSEFVIHFTDCATGTMSMGFLEEEEMKRLYRCLKTVFD